MGVSATFLNTITWPRHIKGVKNGTSGYSVSPSPKKGHGKVLKKGHFQRAVTCYEGTFKHAATC